MSLLLRTLGICLLLAFPVSGFIEGLYCGRENCYDVLELTRSASSGDVSRAYRKMAKLYHPDVKQGSEAKEEAAKRFTVIASAYEVLRDDESRKEYDYMLDNPDEVYHHYYNYFRRRYTPKVDIRIVLVVLISLISAAQYYGAMSRYNEAIDHFLTVPKYRMRATEIAKEEGLFLSDKESKKRNRGRSKDEIRLEEENILRRIIENKMDIKGVYSKPTVYDILWVQLIMFPKTICHLVHFHARWFVKFNINKESLGEEEKEYLIRRNMSLSADQWTQLDPEERQEYMDLELFESNKFKVWKKEKDDEMKAKLADSASYKRYRRWMKKGGAGQITFMED